MEETIEEEIKVLRTENQDSPVSTAEERGTRLPLARVQRRLEEKDERIGEGVVKEGAVKSLQ